MVEACRFEAGCEEALMGGIDIGMKERHRDGFVVFLDELFDNRFNNSQVGRFDHVTFRGHSLIDFDDALMERVMVGDFQREEIGTLLGADAKQVPKSSRHEERCFCPFPFQQGVGGFGGGEAHLERRERR